MQLFTQLHLQGDFYPVYVLGDDVSAIFLQKSSIATAVQEAI